jgi:hypothetical protein
MINTHAMAKLKGRLVLIIAIVRATEVGVASPGLAEIKVALSSSAVKL